MWGKDAEYLKSLAYTDCLLCRGKGWRWVISTRSPSHQEASICGECMLRRLNEIKEGVKGCANG